MARAKTKPETEPTPAPPVCTEVTHTIALGPGDWYLATWRKTPPLPRPEPTPFDLQECLSRLNRVSGSGYFWNWDRAGMADGMSREEAHFWLFAITGAASGVRIKEIGLYLARQYTFDGKLTHTEITNRLKNLQEPYNRSVVVPLANLLSLEELIDLLPTLVPSSKGHPWAGAPTEQALAEQFSHHVLPYLSEAQRQGLHPRFRSSLDPSTWRSYPPYSCPPLGAYLGALLGMSQEIRSLVNSWSDDYGPQVEGYIPHYMQPQRLLFGLDDPKEVVRHMQRFKLKLNTPYLMRGWLAHTERSGLELLRDSVLTTNDKTWIERMMEPLCLVRAPEMAPMMLEFRLTSRNPGPARQWLDQELGNAVAGLIPTATGRGKLAEAAIEFLREAKRKGHGKLIEKLVQQAPSDIAERVRKTVLEHVEKVYTPFDDATTPDWLKQALEETTVGKTKVPDWAVPTVLPSVPFGEQCLNETQSHALLAALQKGPLDTLLPLVKAIKEHGDPSGLDSFGWKLFERWLAEGAPPKEKWALLALGHFGGDASVLKLTPLIRAWPGESQHQRAVIGLEVLRTIGSDTALMQLNGIAQKLKFAGLKKKAQEFMQAIATDKGMSAAELEDRIVPDLELDARGSRTFDFGPRQFKLVFDPNMKPMLKDETGKTKSDLPKPAKTDDPTKAGEAVAAWKLLKKQVKEVLKTQIHRLEQAMVSCRRWKPDEFESLLVKHPLMINLVRLLLWGGYDSNGKLIRTFRVTEEQDCADREDNACTLEGLASVGIVHPLHLGEEERSAWGEVFSDYELLAPFPQLGRRVQKLQPGEEKETKISRFHGIKLEPLVLVGVMDRTGWVKGTPGDAGVFDEFIRRFPGPNVAAILNFDSGIPMGYLQGWEDQEVRDVIFLEGDGKGYHRWKKDLKLLPLGEVDPVVISEVLDVLEALKAKGR
jgi:hypothetical protein